jgi:hypothetical protein
VDFVMSRHALTRAVDMAVDADEIRDAFERPRNRFFSPRTQSWWLARGRIMLAVVEDDRPLPVVTTVMWSRPSDWAADAEFAPLEGRYSGSFDGSRRVRKAIKRSR